MDTTKNKTQGREPAQRVKKPYSKPGFRSERVFETSAFTCGKTPGSNQGSCNLNRKQS